MKKRFVVPIGTYQIHSQAPFPHCQAQRIFVLNQHNMHMDETSEMALVTTSFPVVE